MDVALFLRGLLMGFSIAAPVGPIGILVIRRTLAEGRVVGIVSGLGAATADVLYGCITAFGLTLVSAFLVEQGTWLRLIGGGFLCYLGLRILLAKPAERAAATRGNGLLAAYVSTLFLTLTNPMTILTFAAIFAGLGLLGTGGYHASAVALVAGVFCGSALWWLALSGIVGVLRERVDRGALLWINRVSGAIIVGFGLAAMLSVL